MFNGFEIDMLSLGDADSILVTQWRPDRLLPIRVLIDGGNTGSADSILAFLWSRGIRHIDHLVCSHLHDDHAAGLVSVVQQPWLTIGRAWVHQPRQHLDLIRLLRLSSHKTGMAVEIRRNLATVDRLTAELARRRIVSAEPFAGTWIGPLLVLGPTRDYYGHLVSEFADLDAPPPLDRVTQDSIDDLLEALGHRTSDVLTDRPETTPENNTSIVLLGLLAGRRVLFTSDAGTEALRRIVAIDSGGLLANLDWMQLPHHGSWRNIDQALVGYFRPSTAFVSAAGNRKHPRRAVVSAFKAVGSRVLSTHYPTSTHLWYYAGVVPVRFDYGPAVPLWDAA